MKEPTPERVAPPRGETPRITVGLVLEEDHRKELRVTPTAGTYALTWRDKKVQISQGSELVIQWKNNSIGFSRGGSSIEVPSSEQAHLTPEQSTPLVPQKGITITPIVAGRTFHWRKEVSLTYPGSLFVRHSAHGLVVINEVSFEDYCTCVISSEMSPTCPPEFARAQAVSARSWAYVFLRNKHPGAPYAVCNDDDCQRYQGSTFLSASICEALKSCRGHYLVTPEGHVCPAYYSKSCGGHTEDAKVSLGVEAPGISTVFDGDPGDSPDLSAEGPCAEWIIGDSWKHRRVFCAPTTVPEHTLSQYLGTVDEQGAYFRWCYEVSREELSTRLQERLSIPEFSVVHDLVHGPRGCSGRILSMTVKFEDSLGKQRKHLIDSPYLIRRALHPSFLYSSAFLHEWKYKNSPSGTSKGSDVLSLKGAGWGHAVGLCQIGAVGMALLGHSFEAILKHYFPTCRLEKYGA